MYKPQGLKEIEKDYSKPKNSIPKSMLALFFTLQICFGFNFGFVKHLNKNLQRIAKYMSIFIILVVISILALPVAALEIDALWFGITVLLQYLVNIVILYFTKYNFYDFIIDINKVYEIPEIKGEHIGLTAFVYTIVMFFIKFIVIIVWYESSHYNLFDGIIIPFYVYTPFSFGTDLIAVVYILIYFYVYCYVRNLLRLLEQGKITIKQMEGYYLDLALCYDKIMPFYSKMVIIELMMEVPRIMSVTYSLLLFVRWQLGWHFYAVEIVYVSHDLMRLFGPSIAAEMVNSEVEALKLKLHYQVLKETDEARSGEVLRFLRYIEVRRLQHRLWRVLPVDIRLPISIIGMCATYLVVVLQFSHMYDA